MASKKDLTSLLGRLNTLKTITQTYQQIAANHIRRARTSVVNNRDFITDLLQVFQDVKIAYKEEIIELMKRKKMKDTQNISLIKKNGKTCVVFLAANTGLYGNIVGKTASLVSEYIKKNEADITIIGKTGETIFAQQNPGKKYIFFEFPDGKVDPDQLRKIILHLLGYENVVVIYGQFQSIVSQNPIIVSMNGNMSGVNLDETPKIKYLFEPSLENILVFFEKEIFGLVFEQSIRESQLAKHASRMYALDRAIQNINLNLSRTTLQRHVLHHRLINGKQLNSLTGMSLWSGGRR